MILLRPVSPQFRITQSFGENPALYPSTNGHMGIDYGTPQGTRVIAAVGGRVTQCGLDLETARNPQAGYGIHARITHEDGTQTIYGHLSGCAVSVGQVVNVGEYIGDSGNTGRSTGPHLHFEIRSNKGVAFDPAPYIVDELTGEICTMVLTTEGAGLRVRTGPSKSNGVIANLKPGDKVRVIGFATGTWLQTDAGWVYYDPAWLKTI